MADTLIREGIAYGSQPLSPVPQYWDGASYAKVQGVNGAIRAILFDSAGETFTDASPGSVTVVSSAGGTAVFNSGSPGVVQVALSAGGSAAFSSTVPGNVQVVSSAGGSVLLSNASPAFVEVVLSAGGSAAFQNSNPGNIQVIMSAGGTSVFQKTNPAFVRSSLEINIPAVYSATVTWTAGTTATSSQTLTVGVLTATHTTPNHEIVVTNDGPYAVTANIYKTISANGSTFNTSALATIIAPAEVVSAGVTINAVRTSFNGLFNFNNGLIFRLTVTAAFTATVTNNVIIKEFL
jgi:hypothetical protein